MNYKNLANKRFGNLVALHRAGRSKNGNALWKCRCDCGQLVVARSDRLAAGLRKSCAVNGHYWTGWIEERGWFRRGQHKSERQSWESMWRRCSDKTHRGYHRYGGRGVRICKRWESFANFLADMGVKPTPQHTLDRYPNNAGNYKPGNCRWATVDEQHRNMRNNVVVEYEGQSMLLVDVVEKLGLRRGIVYGRLRMGWSLADALAVPVRKNKRTLQT